MTCPKCYSEFETARDVCPECGVLLLRNVSGIMKTSAVMIAAGREQGFYSSVQDVPEPLRTQLLETTTSQNSGTILIADRAGKEQLTQALGRRESGREDIPQPGLIAREPEIAVPSRIDRGRWLAWGGLVLVLILAGILFVVFSRHW
jgi:hypothetical protein